MIKLNTILKQVLREIGEGTAQPYPFERVGEERGSSRFKLDPSTAAFRFTGGFEPSNRADYHAYIDKSTKDVDSEELVYDVSFGVSKEGASVDYWSETERGEVYRIMATIVQMVREEVEIDRKKGRKVTRLEISPSKASKGDKRRLRIYTAYLEKLIPQATIHRSDTKLIADIEGGL